MSEPHWTDYAAEPVFTTVINATRPSTGNLFSVLGTATSMMRQLDIPRDRIEKLRADVMAAANYDQAIAMIEHWFPVDRGGEQ